MGIDLSTLPVDGIYYQDEDQIRSSLASKNQ
jgi:hypothetical protein